MLKILRHNNNLSHLFKRFRHTLSFISNEDAKEKKERVLKAYMKYLNLKRTEATNFVVNNPKIAGSNINPEEIETTLNYLINVKGFKEQDILDSPTCVLFNPITLENREKVFKECLFRNVKLSHYVKFVSLMNKKVSMLRAYDLIPPYANIINNLTRQLDVPVKVKQLPDSVELNLMRREVMNEYFRVKLGMSEEEIMKARSMYTRLKHRNLASIVDVIHVLTKELHFTSPRIIKNTFLIHAHAENIKQIMTEIPKIANYDIKDVMKDRPKIMMQPCSAIKKTINHIKSFNISEEAIIKCFEVLTLSPETVFDRLAQLKKTKDLEAHFSNPRILRLIHYNNKVQTRMDYLNSLKIRCYSIHLLSASSEAFEKFAYDGIDRTKGVDTFKFMCHQFNKDVKDIRANLKMHPNWLQAPVVEIKNTYDFLRSLGFTNDEIYNNIIILLYPLSRVQPKLNELKTWKGENDENRKIGDVEVRKISNSKLLSLCVYFIESEYHFTGDGVFDAEKFEKNHEHGLMIEPPKHPSSYRYGKTPKNVSEAVSF